MISSRLPTLPEPNQNENKKSGPTKKKGGHEPVTKLEDVVDLIPMGRGVRRLAQEFVDQRQTIHTCSDLLRRAPGGVRWACDRAARGEN